MVTDGRRWTVLQRRDNIHSNNRIYTSGGREMTAFQRRRDVQSRRDLYLM